MYHVQSCSEEDKTYIVDNLVAYNLTKVPSEQEELLLDLSRKAVNEEGKIIGGIIAKMYCWNCVYVDSLWVSEESRGNGLGRTLLQDVEADARLNQATLIHLDTFDFQAKEFYEKLGYEVFGILEGCPKGHTRYYLKKSL
ncbi:GNAT family N-acetyltransferase [Bariatricus sp. SGI.154]|uniref:GNAT family N-acetyltransferase n=1 Tax=Bariatricus sp. SGI.154 TaxID=3420549 RepID=UPI003D05709D